MEKMQEFEAYLEAHFLDENGVVYSQIDGEKERPLTKEFFRRHPDAERFWHGVKISPAGFWMYENCGMTTGSRLAGLCSRMRTPGGDSPQVRELAHRAFHGIRHIYEVGQEFDRGFFPKIWGNRLSRQTSTDQYLYAIYAMHDYSPFADAEELAMIREMIPAMVDFWYRRKYVFDYYYVKDMVWPPLRFPSFLMMAHLYTGKNEYREEALRILKENLHKIPENSRRKHGRLYAEADAVTMDVMNQEILLKTAPVPEAYHETLRRGMKIMWDEAKQTLTEDGFTRFSVPCDPETGKMLNEPEKFGPRMGWSTMIVRAGLLAARHVPEMRQEALSAAEDVLTKLTVKEMYYMHPGDLALLPPDRPECQAHFLSGDAIANALWAAALLEETRKNTERDGTK